MLVGDSGGRWIGGLSRFFTTSVLSPFVNQKMRAFAAMPKHEDLVFLKELMATGKVSPVIDRTYPLSAVPGAIGYIGAGHVRGKVVITV